MDSSSPSRTASVNLPQNLKPKSTHKSLARDLLARRGSLFRRAALLFSVWLLATTPTNLMRLVYFVLMPPTATATTAAAAASAHGTINEDVVVHESNIKIEGNAMSENSTIYTMRMLWFSITLSFLTVVSVIELVLILGLWFVLRQSRAAAASTSVPVDEEAADTSSSSSAQPSLSSILPVCVERPHLSASCARGWWREYGRIVLANALAATLACPVAFAAAHQIGFAAPFWRSRLSPLFWLALSAVVGILTPLLLLVPQRSIRALTCRPLWQVLTCRALRRHLQEGHEPPKSLQRIE